MSREKIIIIDGSGYIFRAYFAIQRLSNSQGFPTNAIYGFINMINKVLEVEKPKYLAIAFDTPAPSFRKKVYPEYKANRLKAPDDLLKQLPWIFKAVDAYGVKRLETPGYEADDVIGTLAKRAVADGYSVEVITGDKDLMQLVGDHVTIYDTMKDRRFDRAGVIEKMGVAPEQIADYLGLMGDSSDNIPGVSGIGEKSAAELLQRFGSIEGLYQRIDEITQPKRRQILETEKEAAFLSRKLATVDCDMKLDVNWDEFLYQGPKFELLQPLCEELEFSVLIKKYGFKREETAFKAGQYRALTTEAELKAFIQQAEKAPWLSLNIEASSSRIQAADLVGIAMSCETPVAVYLPIAHVANVGSQERAAGQIDEETAKRLLKPLLENPQIKKTGQNLKYDQQVLRKWGVDLKGIAADIMIESYLLNPEQSHTLASMTTRLLNHQNMSFDEIVGKGKSQVLFSEVPIDRATQYAAEEADVALRLHNKQYPELARSKVDKLFQDIELPLVCILADMEYEGLLVNGEKLREMSKALEKELAAEEKVIHQHAGEPFNVASPKQLGHILFEKLCLPAVKKTKTGYSTDEGVLESLASKHDICRAILKYRGLAKIKSTYVDGLLAEMHPVTGRIHTSFNQTVAATGRLSSSNPNMQNIPVGGESTYDLRSVFISGPGKLLVSADYSQIELRVLAHMSQDKALMQAFHEEQDIHEFTARKVFRKSKDEPVTNDERRVAKTINYGITYGQTPFGLSQLLKIAPKDAKVFIDTYFEQFSNVRAFMNSVIEGARRDGYVTTLLGRRRFIAEIDSANRMQREMAERAAINAPVQGTAADLIKMAMVRVKRALVENKLKAAMLLQVHDELVLEVPEAERAVVDTLLREAMEKALDLSVPIKVDIGWGRNWRECEG